MIITIPIKNQKDIGTPSDSVVVLGYFDGIHKGHQELFRVANKAARKDLVTSQSNFHLSDQSGS